MATHKKVVKNTARRLHTVRVREPDDSDWERLADLATDFGVAVDDCDEDMLRRKVSRLIDRLIRTPAPDVGSLEEAGRFGAHAAQAWITARDLDSRIVTGWELLDRCRLMGLAEPTIRPGERVKNHPELGDVAPARNGWLVPDCHRYAKPQRIMGTVLASQALRAGAGPGAYTVEDARQYLRLRS